ncbi:YggT family protein [Hyphobacterium sp. HN65]|uniref:YggT family protein n=1 Tax=Hyphobacterium lacteum TaxID=3116575 RepID=A0ABU7LSU2_9PROT|nr:YggT family protein [Hyphobacterium sp. HN65]MEE2526973.1 YggT family protein [Hyphobacterium sp. HN65]
MGTNLSLLDALIVYFLDPVLGLFILILIVGIILSWLISFRIVNPYNPFVGSLWRMTSTLTEPVLQPVRRILPNLGGLDFSPLVVILLIQFIRGWLLPELMFRF